MATIQNCRICTGKLSTPFLDLGEHGLANNLETTQKAALQADTHALALVRCLEDDCQSVQITETVDPAVLFDQYLYVSGASKALTDHFDHMAEKLSANTEPGLVVDIGSNDGVLLKSFKKRGWSVCGVEPAMTLAQAACEDGITTICGYWGSDTAAMIEKAHGKADLITANNVFAHTADLHRFIKAAQTLLNDGGRFVFEVAYMPNMLRDGTFDLTYHEHIFAHHITPLAKLFSFHGLRLVDVEEIPTHGGSIRVTATNDGAATSPRVEGLVRGERARSLATTKPYVEFAARAEAVKEDFTKIVKSYKAEGKKVVGYTCPAKAATLINYCGLTHEDISYIIDDNEYKQGRYMPKSGIPIVSGENTLEQDDPDVIVIFAWNVADHIVPKLPKHKEVIIPMPALRTLRT